MPKSKPFLTSVILVIFDTSTIYIIFLVALKTRNLLSPFFQKGAIPWVTIMPVFQLGLLFLLLIFFLQGLYPGYGLTAVKELEQMGRSISLAFILLSSISYLVKSFQIFPRSILLIAWGSALVCLPLAHFFVRNIVSNYDWYGIPVTVFGDEGWCDEVTEALRRVRRLGWKPRAILPYSAISSFTTQIQDRAHLAVITPSSRTAVEDYIRLLNQHFRKVLVVRQMDNFGSLWVEPRDLDGYLGLEFHYHLLAKHNRLLKRSLDIIGSGFLLVILSPLLTLIALLILIDSPGQIFFQQERLGKRFRSFKVIKFRTMELDAEAKLEQMLKENPQAKAQYETYHKLDNDPRVTRFGKFLRKFSLDELPQLWNVLIGEMSLSGPRAYMPIELGDMANYAPVILRVAPGMTGWWQVLGRHNTTFQKRLEMDEYYISNWSLWMDAYIILKTVFVVLSGSGA